MMKLTNLFNHAKAHKGQSASEISLTGESPCSTGNGSEQELGVGYNCATGYVLSREQETASSDAPVLRGIQRQVSNASIEYDIDLPARSSHCPSRRNSFGGRQDTVIDVCPVLQRDDSIKSIFKDKDDLNKTSSQVLLYPEERNPRHQGSARNLFNSSACCSMQITHGLAGGCTTNAADMTSTTGDSKYYDYGEIDDAVPPSIANMQPVRRVSRRSSACGRLQAMEYIISQNPRKTMIQEDPKTGEHKYKHSVNKETDISEAETQFRNEARTMPRRGSGGGRLQVYGSRISRSSSSHGTSSSPERKREKPRAAEEYASKVCKPTSRCTSHRHHAATNDKKNSSDEPVWANSKKAPIGDSDLHDIKEHGNLRASSQSLTFHGNTGYDYLSVSHISQPLRRPSIPPFDADGSREIDSEYGYDDSDLESPIQPIRRLSEEHISGDENTTVPSKGGPVRRLSIMASRRLSNNGGASYAELDENDPEDMNDIMIGSVDLSHAPKDIRRMKRRSSCTGRLQRQASLRA